MRGQAVDAPGRSRWRLWRLLGKSLVIVLSALAFPSVLPWMIVLWLGIHTVLMGSRRPAWVPLLVCGLLLIAKLVPRTPAMLVLITLLIVVLLDRVRHATAQQHAVRKWMGTVALWLVWLWVAFEWSAIEQCSSPHTFRPGRPIVCIGDSLTDGLLPDHGYPAQLNEMVSVPVINLGVSGISTVQARGMMDRVLSHQPQVVIIELGGHDFLKGHGRRATKQNLVAMIDQFRDAGADVVLMEIPRGFIFDPFASLEREIAYEKDVQLVADTWLRQIVIFGPVSPPGRLMPELRLSDDGIHSNPQGSRAIAHRVLRALSQMYGESIVEPPLP